MITELLIKLGIFFLGITNTLLPNWSIPSEYINAFSTFGVTLKSWNGVIPINAIINVFIIILSYKLLSYSIKVIIGFLSLIRGGGGQGL